MICFSIMIGVEKIVGWALSHHFMHCSEAPGKDAKLKISTERLYIFELLSSIHLYYWS